MTPLWFESTNVNAFLFPWWIMHRKKLFVDMTQQGSDVYVYFHIFFHCPDAASFWVAWVHCPDSTEQLNTLRSSSDLACLSLARRSWAVWSEINHHDDQFHIKQFSILHVCSFKALICFSHTSCCFYMHTLLPMAWWK